MPEEQPRQASSRSVWMTMALAIAIFALVNFGFLTYLRKFTPNLGFWLIDNKWNLLLDLDHSVDVLILGDSTANQGMVPEVIEQKLGLSALNLGTVANLTFLNDVWMLKDYLAQHDPPRAVVIMHSYQMWQREISRRAMSIIPFLRLPNWSETLDPSPMGLIDLVEERTLYLIPAYSQSHTLRIMTRTMLQIPPDFSLLSEQHYTMSELGTYRVEQQDPQNVQEDIDDHFRFLAISEPVISSESLAGLAALKDLSAQYNFQVFLINAPIASPVAESADFPSYFFPIQDELIEFWAETPNVLYVPDVFTIEPESMESADHMLAKAADEFTAFFADHYMQQLTK